MVTVTTGLNTIDNNTSLSGSLVSDEWDSLSQQRFENRDDILHSNSNSVANTNDNSILNYEATLTNPDQMRIYLIGLYDTSTPRKFNKETLNNIGIIVKNIIGNQIDIKDERSFVSPKVSKINLIKYIDTEIRTATVIKNILFLFLSKLSITTEDKTVIKAT